MKFLVALDGSKASDHALEKAIAIAAPIQATILLLNVVEPLISYMPEVMLPTGDWLALRGLPDLELEKKLLLAGQGILDRAKTACTQAGVTCEVRLESGLPRDAICTVASEEVPDLLVLGSRGLGSLERLMLGSVSDYVVHHASCPVMVVR